MARKTFDIEAFKAECNRILALPEDRVTTEFRKGICTALEHVLHEARAYRGYNDVYWLEQGYDEWKADGSVDEFPAKYRYIFGPAHGSSATDPHRRRYY